MDNKTLTHQMGQARGKLMRLEQDLSMAKGALGDATRNRIVGGVVLLIGLLALIGFLAMGSQLVAVIAAAGVLIGGLVFIRALARTGEVRRSVDTLTGGIANARAKLAELKAQPSGAE
jgi:membrane associated rhomboid family serine protease